jgi:hypothetical protein
MRQSGIDEELVMVLDVHGNLLMRMLNKKDRAASLFVLRLFVRLNIVLPMEGVLSLLLLMTQLEIFVAELFGLVLLLVGVL